MNDSKIPKYGFFGRFFLRSGKIPRSNDVADDPWSTRKSERWAGTTGYAFLAENPLLDELHIKSLPGRVVIFDGRIDECTVGFDVDACPESKTSSSIFAERIAQQNSISEQLLNAVVGDFALVLWNESERILTLARDAMGARSLYYHVSGDVVSVASDLGVLVSRLWDKFGLDTVTAKAWLSDPIDSISLPDRTFLDGVKRVIPGTLVQIDSKNLRQRRFWSPLGVPAKKRISLSEAVCLMRQKVSRSLRDRIPPKHVRLGCHISGGLDCSTLAGMLATDYRDAALRCDFVSWTPGAAKSVGSSELDVIEKLSHAWGIRVSHLDAERLEEEIRRWRNSPYDPSASQTMTPFERVGLEMISSECGVMISGWGGDEFASSHGWGLPMELLTSLRLSELGRFLVKTDANYGAKAFVGAIARFGRWIVPATVKMALDYLLRRPDDLRGDPFRFRTLNVNYFSSVRDTQISAYWSGHLVDRMEAWSALGRTQGVQYVYPLLDKRVVELAISLPGTLFMDERESRIVFRSVAKSIWPDGMASASRKMEPGLAKVLRSFASSEDSHQLADMELLSKVLNDKEVLSVLPEGVRQAVSRGRLCDAIRMLRPLGKRLRVVFDVVSWIRGINAGREDCRSSA